MALSTHAAVNGGLDAGPRRHARMPSPALIGKIARCYVAVVAIVYVADLLRQTRDGLTDGNGRPFGDDFINFWSAPYLALHGRAAEIYNFAAFHVFEQGVVGGHLQGYHYSYPPTLLVLMAPLALVPYVPALIVWIAGGWYAFYRALRLAMPQGKVLLFALATPAVFVNAVGGQNGTWIAALFGAGLGLLDRMPVVGGACLGLLICKPQLGIFIPLALVAGRRWHALAAAAASAGALGGLAALCYGPGIFTDFLHQLGALRGLILENGEGVWHRFFSVFVAARRLGAGVPLAYGIQACVGAAAAAVIAALWYRDAPAGMRNAALLLGTCLATPYLQDYDMVFGALVVAWLWQDEALRRAMEAPLFYACAALLLGPLFGASLAHLTGLEFGPLFVLPLFLIAAMRGFAERRAAMAAADGVPAQR